MGIHGIVLNVMSKIIQNAVKIIEDGTVIYLKSTHRHNYVIYEGKSGQYYSIDGGTAYFKRGYRDTTGLTIEDYSLYEDSPDIKEKLLWGTKGPSGQEELKHLPIKELEKSHLKNILKDYRDKLSPHYLETIEYWLTI